MSRGVDRLVLRSLLPLSGPLSIGSAFHFHSALRRISINPSGPGRRHGCWLFTRPPTAERKLDIPAAPPPADRLLPAKRAGPYPSHCVPLPLEVHGSFVT